MNTVGKRWKMPGRNSKETLKKITMISLIWKLAERFGAQGVGFLVSFILARILEPDAYGTIALVMVFTNVLQVFVDGGLANSLIQKKDADSRDFSTVFFFNIIMSMILYVFIWIIAPVIARIYHREQLTQIVRVLSLTLVFSGVKNVQQAYVARNLLFKSFFFSTLGGTVISALVGIRMALGGYGIWALVAQQLTSSAVDTLILWFTVRWRPMLTFSVERFKALYRFGFHILTSRLVDVIYNNLRQMLIGKIYTFTDLAYYNRGHQIPNMVMSNVNTSLDSVLFPVMSRSQEDIEGVKRMTKRAIQVGSFLLWPVMAGMIGIAEPLIRILLTEKWMISLPYLRLFCIYYAMYPLHTPNLNAIMAVGRSDYFIKMEYIKKTIGLIILMVTIQKGVLPLAIGVCVEGVITTFVNAYPNKKLIGYRYAEQLRDVLPNFILSLIMGIIVCLITFLGQTDWVTLLIQIPVGIMIYILGAKVSKNITLTYVTSMIKEMKRK